GKLIEFEIQHGRKCPETARMRQIGPEKSEEPTEPPAPLAINDPSLTNVQADLENIKDPSARRRLASGFVYVLAATKTDGPKASLDVANFLYQLAAVSVADGLYG